MLGPSLLVLLVLGQGVIENSDARLERDDVGHPSEHRGNRNQAQVLKNRPVYEVDPAIPFKQLPQEVGEVLVHLGLLVTHQQVFEGIQVELGKLFQSELLRDDVILELVVVQLVELAAEDVNVEDHLLD